jgi:PAS domain S-box-containing protein
MKRLIFVSSNYPEPSGAAAAVARSLADNDWEITFACDNVRELYPAVMSFLNEKNLLPPEKLPREIEELKKVRFDAVVTFCERSLNMCPTFSGLPAHFHWPLDRLVECKNPENVDCFTELFEKINERVNSLFNHDTLSVVSQLRSNFGSLLNHLADGVMAHDSDRIIFVFNKAAEEITGYSSGDVIGRDCHEVFPGLLCGGKCSFCSGDVKPGENLRYPSQFVDKMGHLRDLEMTSITINPPGKETKGTLIIFRDLTEVNRLKRSLQSTRGFHGIIGRHESIRRVFDTIEELADESVPVLIQGESGVGKELIAEALHNLSSRRNKPFIPVNCGALPEGILESELFGHIKGAFTGAINNKKGRFELADGGTLFLDEIGEISPALQVKLLRVLEEKSFVPVGGEKPIRTDIRIVCATNRNLHEMMQLGEFRKDLYYRLVVYPIIVPPLRERRSDVPLLVNHFLDRLAMEAGRRRVGISPESVKAMQEFDWPGNIRQLSNAVHFAMIKCRDGDIMPDHLPPEIQRGDEVFEPGQTGRPKKLTRKLVQETIRNLGGNRAKAARDLGVSRSTLYRYLS